MLIPFSWLYGAGMMFRNALYDAGILHVLRVSIPVISVGNITTGGTGKTPFVEYCVRYFSSKKKHVAVLSRGYGRQTTGMQVVDRNHSDRGDAVRIGDEPFQLARKFPEATIIVDADRQRSASHAVKHCAADVIVLDDGFQHRALGRDIDIVMVDHSVSLQETAMLPAGMRREPLGSLRRAHVVAHSRIRIEQNVEETTLSHEASRIKVSFEPHRCLRFDGLHEQQLSELSGKSCMAFSGIGAPSSFRTLVLSLGMKMNGWLEFSDHHVFTEKDIQKIIMTYRDANADILLTTEKDIVRLLPLLKGPSSQFPFYYIEIVAKVIEGESDLHRRFETLLQRYS